jgi:hypothetical protein
LKPHCMEYILLLCCSFLPFCLSSLLSITCLLASLFSCLYTSWFASASLQVPKSRCYTTMVASQTAARDAFGMDVEQKAGDDTSLKNDTVRSFAWQGITVTIKDRKTKEPKAILANVDGYVEAGKFYFYILGKLFRCLYIKPRRYLC